MGIFGKKKQKQKEEAKETKPTRAKAKRQAVAERPIVADERSDDDGNGHRDLKADDLETLRDVATATHKEATEALEQEARALGYDLVPASKDGRRQGATISPEAKLELLNHVFRADKKRMRELTYLTCMHAHLLSSWETFEKISNGECDNGGDDPFEVYRLSFLSYRRSVERWLPMQALNLVGVLEEQKALDGDFSAKGV